MLGRLRSGQLQLAPPVSTSTRRRKTWQALPDRALLGRPGDTDSEGVPLPGNENGEWGRRAEIPGGVQIMEGREDLIGSGCDWAGRLRDTGSGIGPVGRFRVRLWFADFRGCFRPYAREPVRRVEARGLENARNQMTESLFVEQTCAAKRILNTAVTRARLEGKLADLRREVSKIARDGYFFCFRQMLAYRRGPPDQVTAHPRDRLPGLDIISRASKCSRQGSPEVTQVPGLFRKRLDRLAVSCLECYFTLTRGFRPHRKARAPDDALKLRQAACDTHADGIGALSHGGQEEATCCGSEHLTRGYCQLHWSRGFVFAEFGRLHVVRICSSTRPGQRRERWSPWMTSAALGRRALTMASLSCLGIGPGHLPPRCPPSREQSGQDR